MNFSEMGGLIEWVKIAQGFFGVFIGGGLVILGGWLSDRRKQAAEDRARSQQEKALLTGMFSVRNYIVEQISKWDEDGLHSRLEHLRTAQSYVHRFIDKTPSESELLMVTVTDIGISLDALISTMDRHSSKTAVQDLREFSLVITQHIESIMNSINVFDAVSGASLDFISEEEIATFKRSPRPDSDLA